jgi:hypothetical protein
MKELKNSTFPLRRKRKVDREPMTIEAPHLLIGTIFRQAKRSHQQRFVNFKKIFEAEGMTQLA